MDHDRIQSRPEIMMGKPVIRGTRITVEHVLQKLADGWSTDEICGAYPQVTAADVEAALRFAAEHISHQAVWAAE